VRSVGSISILGSKAKGITSAVSADQRASIYNPNNGLRTLSKESMPSSTSSFDSRWLRSVFRAVANRKRPPSLDTPRNRLARQLCNQIESSGKSQYRRLLKRLRVYGPLSKETLKLWSRALADYVLLIDPKFERFTELKSVTLGAHSTGDKRSKLQKFFHPAFKQLAAR
jgi:hypothetical protein